MSLATRGLTRYFTSSTTLPMVVPLSSWACARLRLAALRRPKLAGHGRAQHAAIDELGRFAQQAMLLDHVGQCRTSSG